uniref:Reverse transcriptase domain-containing protein n=1 Tax=Nicotiana tabacum TaxID=4097 RepID=A0A1S3Z7A7_TOBAC|nr:PREDICTED: uncharacterized protein LOC107783619 [Nicotiana tabacum]
MIVVDNQAAFIEGRSLIHNVLICHDILRHYNRKTTPRCLIKIDLKKAYDMVRWEFLEEVLKGYGFPIPFIHWIMLCVTTTTFTVKVNGGGFGYFEGKRGLRQGDLMSPLMMEVVNHLSEVSGLVANMEKSNIFLAGMVDELKQIILSNTGFSAVYNFWGAVFVLPQSVIKEVDRKCREYL